MGVLTIKEPILEITSSGANTRYFVVTKRHVYEYDGAAQQKMYDLPSIPCSKLHLGVNGWGIVCEHHIRTSGITIPHGIHFKENETIRFVDERTVECSETPSSTGTVSVIGFTTDAPALYTKTPYVWQIRPYSKQLARELKLSLAPFASVKKDALVLTVSNGMCGHILPEETFLNATQYGVLTCRGKETIRIYMRTANGLEKKLVLQLYGTTKKQRVFGTIPDRDTYVIGWNEENCGHWQIVQLVSFRKRAKGVIFTFSIIMITIFLVCLILGI